MSDQLDLAPERIALEVTITRFGWDNADGHPQFEAVVVEEDQTVLRTVGPLTMSRLLYELANELTEPLCLYLGVEEGEEV